GIVTSAFFTALISLIKYVADPEDSLPTIVYWLLGSFNGASAREVAYVALPVALAGTVLLKMRHVINILSLGDEEARALGLRVGVSRWAVLGASALLIAATVSVSGIVGWVGLIVPHIARMLTGPNHARLLTVSMLIGAIYMIAMDTLARSASYGEIPIGILTALVGAPLFGVLLFRVQRQGWRHD
ncbi:MAG: iron ABC transporter permease, partial [Pseudomonadota bacterium]